MATFSTGSIYEGRSLTLTITETNINTATNTSDVNWTLTTSGGTSSFYDTGVLVQIDGNTVYSKTADWTSQSFPAARGSVSGTVSGIKHNDQDGSKTISVVFNAYVYYYTYHSYGGNVTLTNIPRASGIACSSPNIGDTAIITIDRKSSSFTNTVTYEIGSLTGTVATKTSSTVLSLSTESLKDSIYALIPNSTSISCKVYCTTYNGSTQIGSTQSASFNLYAVKDDCKPTVSATVVDTNESTIAITGDSSKFIKYVSKPKVTITATVNKSSTIKSYSINLNDGQTSNLQESTFSSIGSDSITVNATDSRGYDNPTTVDLSERMIDYIKLHLNTIELTRPEGTSNEVILNANGVWFNGSFNTDNTNTLTAKFQYRLTDTTEWTDGGNITATTDGNTFKFTDYSLGNLFDYDSEYQFKIIINDLIMTIGNLEADIITVPKGQEVIAIGEDEVYVYGDLLLNDISLNKRVRVARCELHGNQSISANTTTVVQFDTTDEVEGITYIDGGIRIDNDTTKAVVVTAKLRSNETLSTIYAYIYKNDIDKVSHDLNNQSNITVSAVIPVTNGDEITVRTYFPEQANLMGYKTGEWVNASFLCIG